MITKRIEFVLVSLVALATLSSPAWAEMLIMGYTPSNPGYIPQRHDRFYVGEDRAFLGEQFDWSGVGRMIAPDGRDKWATMITPQYFLTARHSPAAGGSTITFYTDNTLESAQTYTVDDWYVYIDNSDLCIRRLTQPVSSDITYYPIHNEYGTSERLYRSDAFYAYGKPNLVGRNIIDSIENAPNGFTGTIMKYNYSYDAQTTVDECCIMSYDSGAPSFIATNDELALIGIHYILYGPAEDPDGSADTLVPHYLTELSDFFANLDSNKGDANMDGIVDDIDATILAANWNQGGMGWEQGDFDGDGFVNEVDANWLSTNWQTKTNWLKTTLPQVAAVTCSTVPEPTTGIFILLGMLFAAAVYSRRGKKA